VNALLGALLFGAGGVAGAALLWVLAASAARTLGSKLGALPWWAPLISAAVSILAGWLGGWTFAAAAAAAALVGGVVCAITDLQTGFVFDRTLIAAAIAVFGFGAATVQVRALAAAAIGALYALPYVASRGQGFGLGDVKLGALLGAGLGLAGGISAFAASFIVGAVFALIALALGRVERRASLPFAPFMAVGAIVGLALPARLPV